MQGCSVCVPARPTPALRARYVNRTKDSGWHCTKSNMCCKAHFGCSASAYNVSTGSANSAASTQPKHQPTPLSPHLQYLRGSAQGVRARTFTSSATYSRSSPAWPESWAGMSRHTH